MNKSKPCYLFTNGEESVQKYNDILVWQPDGKVVHIYGRNVPIRDNYVSSYISSLSDEQHPRRALNNMLKIPRLKYIGRL